MNIWLFVHEIRPVHMKMRNYFRIWSGLQTFLNSTKVLETLEMAFFVQSSCLFPYFLCTFLLKKDYANKSLFSKVLQIFPSNYKKKVLFWETGVEIFTSLKFYDKCPAPFLFWIAIFTLGDFQSKKKT